MACLSIFVHLLLAVQAYYPDETISAANVFNAKMIGVAAGFLIFIVHAVLPLMIGFKIFKLIVHPFIEDFRRNEFIVSACFSVLLYLSFDLVVLSILKFGILEPLKIIL
ncbi:hypothetical protein PSE10A_46400 [Pseudomonas amygdali pv. eriobotryae]|uniref:Uncharacterized protein n=1 Tax=Pseudomonas amygdali pv. eriobotryae TaxID=129137 RepID=A0A9P3AHI3_PSEA0|nr:hypothetical protein [Pseudomonas amygdali]GFZ62129.1 hypothetical protein PSE10A_46400 [Pseudomonas amygdali pv. eriobotryae]